MIILNCDITYKTGLLISLILVQALVLGCLFNPANVENSQLKTIDINTSSTVPTLTFNGSNNILNISVDQKTQSPQDRSVFDSITISVRSVEITTSRDAKRVILDLSIKNENITDGFFLDEKALVCYEQDGGQRFYPKTDNIQNATKTLLIPSNLSLGQERQGTVVFEVWGNVKSIILYAAYPNWTLVGESAVIDVSKGSINFQNVKPQKKFGLIVNSATNQHTMPGWNNRPGTSIAVINVSITNYGTTNLRLPRENIFIITERGGRTLDKGGDRAPPEYARNYFRFPVSIAPGETKTGSIVYIVYTGTKINKLVLTDSNYVINSMVDLNDFYVYS